MAARRLGLPLLLLAACCAVLLLAWLGQRADRDMRHELADDARLAVRLMSSDHMLAVARNGGGELDRASLFAQLDGMRRSISGCTQAALISRWATGSPAVVAVSHADPAGQRAPFRLDSVAAEALRQAQGGGEPQVVGPLDDADRTVMVFVAANSGADVPLALALSLEGTGWRMEQLRRVALPALLVFFALGLLIWFTATPAGPAAKGRPVMWRLMPPVMLMVAVLVFGFGSLQHQREEERMHAAVRQEVRDLNLFFQKSVAMQRLHLRTLADAVTNSTADLADKLQRRDAGALLAANAKRFQEMSRDSGVTQLLFIAADGTCILRAHAPEIRGDVIRRASLAEAERTGNATSGMEVGRTGVFSVRAVQPVYKKGQLAGFVEIGKDLDDLVSDLRSNLNVEMALLVRKERLNKEAWEEDMRRQGLAPNWEALRDEVATTCTMGALPPEILDRLNALDSNAPVNEVPALGREWMLLTFPLTDAGGRDDVRMLVLADATAAHADFRKATRLAGAGLGALSLLLFSVLYALLRRTDQDILDREEALRKSQDTARKLSRAVEQSPVTVVITDLKGSIEYVNPKFSETTGYTMEEALGQNPRILKSGDLPPDAYRAMWETISAGNEWRGEFRNRKKDGSEYWEHASISPVRDATGAISHYLAVKEDISDRKRAEESLRASEARFRRLFDASSVPMAYLEDGRVLDVNERFTLTFGYTLEDIPDQATWQRLAYPDEAYRDQVQSQWREAMATSDGGRSDIIVFERRIRCKDGQERIIITSGISLDKGLLVTLVDITERKKAEDEARELADRLHKIASRVPGAVFQYLMRPDGSSCFPYASEGMREVYRVDPEELRESAAKAAAVIHPEDAVRMDASILASARSLKPWRYEYRVRFADGTVRWMAGSAVPQREPDGSTLWHGFISDITERRSAQEALRNSEQALRDLYSQAPVGIFRSTPNGRYLSVNPYYARMYGFASPDEMIAAVTSISRQMYRNQSDRDWLLAQLEQMDEVRNFVVERMTRDGAALWVSLSIRATRDEDGKILHLDGFCTDITEQKLAQQALTESESRFRALFENSPVAYLALDDSGSILDGNSELESLLGRSLGELVGRDFLDFCAEESRAAFAEGASCIAADGHCSGELQVIRQDGQPLTVLMQGRAQNDAGGGMLRFHCVLYNITERKVMEAALREATERHQRIADTVPLALYDYVQEDNGESWYQYLSPRFEDIFELPPADVVDSHKGILPLVHPEDRERLLAMDRMAAASQSMFNVEVRIVTPMRRVKWVHLMSRPRRDDAGRTVWSGFMLDVTLRKQMEERVREASRQLEQTTARAEALAAQAEAASRAKGEFLANMSHEIRTPMNAVIGLTHLALTTELSPKQRDYLGKIDRAARSLLGILNDILDFSKVEAGMLSIESVDFDLDLVLDDLIGMLAVRAHEKGLEILLDVGQGAPGRYSGDPLRLNQVLVNLVGNAIKFTEKGEVSLQVEALPNPLPGHALLRFCVRDTGIGMTPEQLATLFQPFTQADASTTRRFGGTGLGLSISQRLVQLMGAELKVTSTPGQGSDFCFDLSLPLAAEQGRPASPESLSGRRALVVDDSRASREIISAALRRLGLSAATAASGPEALALLEKEGGEPFELVVVDWKMPDMDGVELAQRIRANAALAPQPSVVMLTAHDREALGDLTASGLVQALLLKPVSQSLLLNTLMEVFGFRAAGKPRPEPDRQEADLRQLPGVRVLLVEDNEINQQVGAGMLERMGVSTTVASDGETALALLEVEQFDAVLMDIQMPGMDGYETTRRIRENEPLKRLPVIAMTAHALPADRERTRAAGMDDHVTKPIDPGALYAALARQLPEAARAKATAQPAVPAVPAGDLPGLDAAAALERLGGDPALYRDLLNQLLGQYRGHPDQILRTVQNGDPAQARALAHSLRGVAGNLGALEVEAQAKALEAALENERELMVLAPLCQALANALKALDDLLPGLESALDTAAEPAPAIAPASAAKRREVLAALQKALHTRRPRACNAAVADVLALAWPATEQQQLTEIAAMSRRFKYAEALELVEAILARLEEEA